MRKTIAEQAGQAGQAGQANCPAELPAAAESITGDVTTEEKLKDISSLFVFQTQFQTLLYPLLPVRSGSTFYPHRHLKTKLSF